MIIVSKSFFLTSRIKTAWKNMETDDRVTPFLYLSYMKYVRWQNYFVARIPVFFIAEDERGCILMIAPMAYDCLSSKYNTLGDVGFCDITDFLFKHDLSNREKTEILNLLHDYIGKNFLLSRLPAESETIASFASKLKIVGKVSCVNIPLDEDYQTNIKRLSSSVRQNIRTAYNRLNRDSKKIHLDVHYGCMNNSKKLKWELKKCYEKRHFSAYSGGLSLLRYFIHFIAVKYLRHDNFSLFENDNSIQAALFIDGKVAGMFAGIINKKGDRLIIPRLAVDMDYGFYSPGYVMLCEAFQFFLSHSTIRNIDLCRGTEKYKLELGG